MTGSGLQSIAPDRGHRLARERRSTRGKKARFCCALRFRRGGQKKCKVLLRDLSRAVRSFPSSPVPLLRADWARAPPECPWLPCQGARGSPGEALEWVLGSGVLSPGAFPLGVLPLRALCRSRATVLLYLPPLSHPLLRVPSIEDGIATGAPF